MKKVITHTLTCRCSDCVDMFPPDRYEAAWTLPRPEGAEDRVRRALARIPLGHPLGIGAFVLWVDLDSRLATDFPGMPGTLGARVDVDWHHHDGPLITGTKDPALAALAAPIPLRRTALERINARCMVDYGLAPDDVADFVPCEAHGHGVSALTCACLLDTPTLDAVVVYGVDGDYPDLFCTACFERFTSGELDVARTVCSRCQQQNLYRHRITASTWYGAPPNA